MIRTILAVMTLSTPAAALDMAPDADIVLLGEIHDNPLHHQGQGDLIRQAQPKAVVFEMLSPAQAAKLNATPREDMAKVAARIGWASSNWPDFELYQPVFEALEQIPAVGAAALKADVRRAFSEGLRLCLAKTPRNSGWTRQSRKSSCPSARTCSSPPIARRCH